jgi:antitoxin (DNA-binding transcriptional repressor) of toxin-antitoxin stability system
METITLKDLHQHTGRYARAARENPVLITDRGRPVAMLTVPVTGDLVTKLPRRFTLASAIVPKRKTDSTAGVSAIRDER